MEGFYLGLFTIVFGAIVALAGYQLYRVLLPIWGLIAGFIWGAHIVDLALGEGFLSTLTGWGAGIIVGIAGALLAYAFYQAAVSILVGLIGFYVTYGVMLQLGAEGGALTTLASLLAAVAVASMVIYFRVPKAVLMGITAFSGAAAIMGGVLVMSGQIAPSSLGTGLFGDIVSGSTLWSITWAALAILGMASQALIDRNLQQSWEEDYAISDRAMMGALGGEVERDRPNDYNRFDDEEVETVDHIRRRALNGDNDRNQS